MIPDFQRNHPPRPESTEAFQEGWEAARDESKSNPYPPFSVAANQWETGLALGLLARSTES